MNWKNVLLSTVGCALLSSVAANAAFVLEVDIDGLDDGPITYNPNFSFGGDTTTASTSIASAAFGLSGADSIFGGDGTVLFDTYVYTYDPSVDADNLVIAQGQDLGNGNLASGIAGGGVGLYNIYATWPFTTNVGGGDTGYNATTLGDSFGTTVDQNNQGDAWVLLGQISYTSGGITVSQSPTGSNTFVSMRAAALLFERAADMSDVPEPSTFALFGLGVAGLWMRRRRVS